MRGPLRKTTSHLLRAFLCAVVATLSVLGVELSAQTPLGGFIPFVGIGLTDEFQTLDDSTLYNFAIPENSLVGSPVSASGQPYYELALLDTGAATHILTPQADAAFGIVQNGFDGDKFQTVGGATGLVNLRINNPLGFFATGLGDRTSEGAQLGLNAATLRGQSSTATLSAPQSWTLPNIVGLPMAAQHAIVIRNDQPQVFQHQINGEMRTVRTPQVDFRDLGLAGAGAGLGGADIVRRTDLTLESGIGFIQGPFYLPDLDVGFGLDLNFHLDPQSPTVLENGGLFVEVDITNGDSQGLNDKGLLFDTGASLTVLSQRNAARLGFDPLIDTPDFVLQVEGSGGVSDGVPGFYVDELRIDTVGGGFTLQNVPVAVLDVPNPADPGNVVDGILGMNVFEGRNLVIDANPSTGAGGAPPSLYISDPVVSDSVWANAGASGDWNVGGEWQGGASPGILSHAKAIAVGADRTANVTTDELVNRLTVAGESGDRMTVEIAASGSITTVGEALIESGGEVFVNGGRFDTQELTVTEGGVLKGEGELFIGTGPVVSPLRNLGGRIEVGADTIDAILTGTLEVDGDLSNGEGSVIAFELAGTTPGSGHDRVNVDRFAFLSGELEVDLIPGYTPTVGDTYTLLTTQEGVTGQFESLDLPTGFLWQVDYSATSVTLELTGIGLAGDFNSDGVVDAADYSVWRDGLGSTYTAADYTVWANNFGATQPSSSASVPEPTTMGLLLGLLAIKARRHR